MKKIICFISVFIFLIILSIFGFLYFNYDLEIVSIKQLNFNINTNEITIEVIKKKNIFDKNYSCVIFNDSEKIIENGVNNKCILKFKIGADYNLILKMIQCI